MYERFTESARQVVVLAADQSRRLMHNYIGTEHLLLGLLAEKEGLGARVLAAFDVTIDEVRARVVRVVGQGDEAPTGQIPFTPRSKKVLELALRESLSLGHNYIGTEHILLGLARENEGVATCILLDLDVDSEKIRTEVISQLARETSSSTPLPDPRPYPDPYPWGFDADPDEVFFEKRPPSPTRLVVTGWLLFGVAASLGVLVGWLIWG